MHLLHLFLVHRVRAFFLRQVHKRHGVRAQAFEGFVAFVLGRDSSAETAQVP